MAWATTSNQEAIDPSTATVEPRAEEPEPALPAGAAAAAAEAAATAAALLPRARLIDRQGPSLELLAVQLVDAGLGLIVGGHLYKGKALGSARISVANDGNRFHLPVGTERFSQFVLTGLVR